MPMIVRHKESGEYATEAGWTKDRKLARGFVRLDYAILYRDNQPNAADSAREKPGVTRGNL